MRFLAGFVFVSFVLVSPRLLACSCSEPDFPDAVKDATHVFRGTVSKIVGAGDKMRRVSFSVSRTWKGSAPVDVLAHHELSTCEMGFEAGKEYLIVVKGNEPVYVNICSSSKPAAEASREFVYLEKRFPAKPATEMAAKKRRTPKPQK